MSEQPWSDNPNAPQILSYFYFIEKAELAGAFIGLITYGVAVALFFKCMSTLLNPVGPPREGIKWGLAAHTTVMFSLVTAGVAINNHVERLSYIDNRAFPGADTILPGPLGYQFLIYGNPLDTVQGCIFVLNSSLVDGLLLYRCYIIYAMNYWAIALPCLMYLASMATGITLLLVSSQTDSLYTKPTAIYDFNAAFYSISFSLNLLLTFMIVVRLARHGIMIRKALGAGVGGTYKTIVIILVESFAFYAVNYVLFLGTFFGNNDAVCIFQPILGQVQVITPFLIVLRVAKRTALSNESIVSGVIGSIRFNSPENLESCNETQRGGNFMGSVDENGENPGDLRVGAENTIDEVSR